MEPAILVVGKVGIALAGGAAAYSQELPGVCDKLRSIRLPMTRRWIRTRRWIAATLVLCASVFVAHAQSATTERQVKVQAGRDVRVAIYLDVKPDCTSGPLPAIRLLAPPAHGTVTVKRGMLKATNVKQCLATDLPAFVAFYRARADFSGNDEFQLEITFPMGRKEIQHFAVTVSGSGQGV